MHQLAWQASDSILKTVNLQLPFNMCFLVGLSHISDISDVVITHINQIYQISCEYLRMFESRFLNFKG